jgi:hypothetical protein
MMPSGPREASEPPWPKLEAPRVIATRSVLDSSAMQADSGDDEPALAVYSRPVPVLAFARADLTELTPDPVAHALITPRRTSSSPAIEVRPASIAPAEVLPPESVPPPSSVPGVPGFTDPTDAAAWPSSLRPGSSRATIFVAAAAVVAAVVIGLSIRSGSRSPSHRASTPPSAAVAAQRPSPAEPVAARSEASATPAATPSAAPSPVETATAAPPEPKPVAQVTRRPAAEAAEPPVSPPPRRREPLAKQLSNAADDSVSRLGSDETAPEEKPPSKSFSRSSPNESRSGLDDPAPTKPSEAGNEAKRRVLTEPGF